MGQKPEVIDITGVAAGGAGVGRLSDGRVTFVHRTAPGDRVEVRVTESRRRWARSRLVRVLASGPERRVAPCPHYRRCGGCTIEHLSYEGQLAIKARLVADALRRIGGLETAEPTVVPSPLEFRYRNRVSFALRRQDGGVVAGFRELERPDRVLDMGGECLLPEEAVARSWDLLRSAWGTAAHRLPSGEELRLTLRAVADGGVTLLVDGGYGPGRPDDLVASVPPLRSVWHRPVAADTYRLLAGDQVVHEWWGGEEVRVTEDVFLQVNRSAAALLEAHVMELAFAAEPARVLDAYCGVGLYSRRLARAGVEVVGIEAHPGAVAEARRGAPGARIMEGTVEALMEQALPVDVAILNPPRAGLDRAVVGGLAAQPPARLLYVSCDPATLARDLGRLESEYRLVGVWSFDLFPQTAHVETVVELSCATT